MTIHNFSIEYDAIDSRSTFTNGDLMTGRIILETSKETTVQSLIFIGEGRAHVCWSEHYGQHQHHVYWAEEKYYRVTQHILRESRRDGTEVLSKGRHVFPFSFQIPDRKMPSTFKTSVGKVVHKIKAELRQSLKLTKKAKTHFTFVSKADMDTPGLLDPQGGSKDKTLLFGSGMISLDIHTARMGYQQGETLEVTSVIANQSSRLVKPKFVLYEKRSYFAQGRRKVITKQVLKGKTEAVSSGSSLRLTEAIQIPRALPPSILNCSIIRLEYRLKVFLDIKYAKDPKVKLPIVILPAQQSLAAAAAPPPSYASCSNLYARSLAPPYPTEAPYRAPRSSRGAYGPYPDLSAGTRKPHKL